MLQRILKDDPDKVFPYTTERVLRIKDKWLAIFGLLLTLSVLLYIVIYVFYMLQHYSVSVRATGYNYFRTEGKAYSYTAGSGTQVWDIGDMIYPEQDSSGFFIGIHLYRIREQTIGYCGKSCEVDEDCPDSPPHSKPKCLQSGKCEQINWCPSMDSDHTEFIEEIEVNGFENVKTYIWTGIDFDALGSPDYISHKDNTQVPYPDDRATVYNLGDILSEAGIDDMNDIRMSGAIVELKIYCDCDVEKNECTPKPQYERIDGDSKSVPIIFNRAVHYYSSEGVEYRDYYRWVAVKVFITSKGRGYKFSLIKTVIQIASALALIKLSTSISDFGMWHFTPGKERRELLRAFKVENSVDFSDKADRIDYIKWLRLRREAEA